MTQRDQWAAALDPFADEPGAGAGTERVRRALAEPGAWDGPPPDLRSRLLAAVEAEAAGNAPEVVEEPGGRHLASVPPAGRDDSPATTPLAVGSAAVPDEPVVDELAARRAQRRRRVRGLLTAVAGFVVGLAVAGLLAATVFATPDAAGKDVTTFAIAGAKGSPAATADADIEPLRAGIRIVLRIKGLPPSPPGTYYAAWLKGPEGTVPIGTFHWRQGGIPIELWSGVDTDEYPTLTVTRQREGTPLGTPGLLMMTGPVR